MAEEPPTPAATAGATAGASAGASGAGGDGGDGGGGGAGVVASKVVHSVAGMRCYSTRGVGGGRRLVAQGNLRVMQVGAAADTVGTTGASAGAGAGTGAGAGARPLTFLMMGAFSYPLVGQMVLRVGAGHWVLPSDGDVSWGLVDAACDGLEEQGAVVKSAAGSGVRGSGAGSGAGAGAGAGAGDASRVREVAVAGLDALLRRYCEVHDHDTGTVLAYDPTCDPTAPSYLTVSAAAVAGAIEAGSSWLASSLVTGAAWAGSGLAWGASYLKSTLAPASDDSEVEVDTATHARLQQAKVITGVAVSVTSTLVDAVTAAAASFGSAVAGAFSTTSYGQALAESTSTETGVAVKQVAMSGIAAAGTVLAGMETAAKVLFAGTAAATRDVVQHRYGANVGEAVATGMAVAGDVGATAWNFRKMGTKALLRATTTGAAVELLDEKPSSGGGAKQGAAAASTDTGAAGSSKGLAGDDGKPADAVGASSDAACSVPRDDSSDDAGTPPTRPASAARPAAPDDSVPPPE